MKILRVPLPHVHNTVNGQRTAAFSAVEAEIPTLAATCAFVYSKSSGPVHVEGSIREVLGKDTFLC